MKIRRFSRRRPPDNVTSEIRRLWLRDHGICQLCGEEVEWKESSVDLATDKRAASRDHVLPRKHGGRSEMGNYRLAHAECNSIRGNWLEGDPIGHAKLEELIRKRETAKEAGILPTHDWKLKSGT